MRFVQSGRKEITFLIRLCFWKKEKNFSNRSPTRCNNFSVYYPDVYLQLNSYHHDTKVKAEAATAVVELLVMGGRTPETCWAVNKRHDKKLKNCCIWLVIYLNCTMVHGHTNLKERVLFVGFEYVLWAPKLTKAWFNLLAPEFYI